MIIRRLFYLAFTPILLISSFYLLTFISWHLPQAHGQIATSSSFLLNQGDFVTSGLETANSSSFQATLGLNSPTLFHNPLGGYQNISFFSGIVTDPNTYTTLNIDQTNINLGSLTSGIFNNKTSQIDVATNNPTGYTIFANQDHPLTISNGIQTIQNTNCDTTATCSAQLARPWISPTATGFGFNAQGGDITPDFVDASHFRPFADTSLGQPPAIIANRNSISETDAIYSTQITYQANVRADQTAGIYQNYIFYTAQPNL